MTRDDIKEIVASDYARATKAIRRGQKIVNNARVCQRRAMRAILTLKMEVPEVEVVSKSNR